MERLLVILDVESSRFRKGMVGARGSVNAFDTAVRDVRRSLMSLMSVYAGVKLGGMFLQAAKETEKFRMQLQTVLKSAEAGNAAFQWARDFARQTPHDTANVVQAFNIMTATGIKGVQGFMTAIGDAAYVMNKDIVDVATAVVSLEKRVWRRMGVTINRVGKEWSVSMKGIKIVTEHNLDAVRAALKKVLTYNFGHGMELAKGQWAGTMAIMRSLWWEFRSDVMGSGESGSPFTYMIVKANEVRQAWENWAGTEDYTVFIEKWQKNLVGALEKVIGVLFFLGKHFDTIIRLIKVLIEQWILLKIIGKITILVKAFNKVMADSGRTTKSTARAIKTLNGALITTSLFAFIWALNKFYEASERVKKSIRSTYSAIGTGGGLLKNLPGVQGTSDVPDIDSQRTQNLKAWKAKSVQDRMASARELSEAEEALAAAAEAALAERQAAYEKLKKTVESLSKSIRSDWISSTKTALEQNDIWLKDQLAALDAVKSANQNYETDVTRLKETHAARQKEILEQQTEDVKSALIAQVNLMRDKVKYGFASASSFIDVLEEMKSTLPELSEEWQVVTDAITDFTEQTNQAEKATEKLGDTMKDALSEKLKAIPDTLSGAFASAIVYGQNLSESLKSLAQDIVYTIVKAWILKSLFGGVGSLFGGSIGAASAGVGNGASASISIPGLASGGPVSAGKSYIVGEEGPELFSPSSSGSIIPNGTAIGGGGGDIYNINMTIKALDSKDVSQVLSGQRGVIESLAVESIKRNGPLRAAVKGA